MKRLILLAALLSVPAYATNLMYAPIVDPGSKQPAVIYLTDDQNTNCNGKWYIAHILNDQTGKNLMRSAMCWAFNEHYGVDTKIPATGFFAYADGGFIPVPGTHDAYSAVFRDSQVLMHQEFKAQLNAIQQAKPHP